MRSPWEVRYTEYSGNNGPMNGVGRFDCIINRDRFVHGKPCRVITARIRRSAVPILTTALSLMCGTTETSTALPKPRTLRWRVRSDRCVHRFFGQCADTYRCNRLGRHLPEPVNERDDGWRPPRRTNLMITGCLWDPDDVLDATSDDEDIDGDGKPDDVLTL